MIDGIGSGWSPVTYGVLKGIIILGQLFLIYVNDIGEGSISETRLFADDCDFNGKRDTHLLQLHLDTVYKC